MSMRAASQPSPKKSANPKSHQSSKSIARLHPGRRHGLTAYRGVAAGAKRAPQPLDLAALAEHARHAREDADPGAESEEQEQGEDDRHLPDLPQEEPQLYRVGVHERKAEYRKKKERPQKPRQMFDESHQSKTAAPCRCRRSNYRRPDSLFLIDPLAQFLARLEVRHEFLRHLDPLARLGVAA